MAAPPPLPPRRRSGPSSTVGDLDDAALVAAIADGDQRALAELYRRHSAAVYGLALRVLHRADVAQEIVQEVMVAIWERPDRYDAGRGALRPFMLRMAHGRAVDRLRADARRSRREDVHERDRPETGDLDREIWELLRADAVREAVGELTDGERRAIELAYFGGHTYREVASLLGEAEGTVKSRIRTGLRRLADRLEAAGLGPTPAAGDTQPAAPQPRSNDAAGPRHD